MGHPPITRVPAPPITKPGATDLIYTPETPSLAAFAQTELGNAGTPADGFDASLGLVAGNLPSDLRALNGMDVSIADLAGADREVTGFEVDTDIANFGAVADAGNPLIDAVDTDLSIPPDTGGG